MEDTVAIYFSNGEKFIVNPTDTLTGIRKSNDTLDEYWFKSFKFEGIEVDFDRELTLKEEVIEFLLNCDYFTNDEENYYSTNSVVKVAKL